MKLIINDLERFFKKSFLPAAEGSNKKTYRSLVINTLKILSYE